MLDWLSRWAIYSPTKLVAKEFETGRTLSYAELNRLGNRLANHLTRDLGLGKGDRVAILAENCLEYLVLFSAMQKTGIILVPFNYRLSTQELNYLIRDAAPQLIITQDSFQETVEQAEAFSQVIHRYTLAHLRNMLTPAVHKVEDISFKREVGLTLSDSLFILYTSGTTGFPKGALYTHEMLLWNSLNTELRLHITGDDRTIKVMPPFHTGGWNVLLTPFLQHGGYVCLMKKFEAATVLALLEQEKCTLFMGVPTMLKMMAEEPRFESVDLSSLRYIIVGGEAMPVPLIETWAEKGIPIRQGYGMTEVGPNLFSLHQDDAIRKKGSIGQPNFYLETRIVDEKGDEVPANTPGELWLKGKVVTPGYWQNKAATEKSITDGWFHTGDRVRCDEEGYYYVVDRIKNMFISGGENVYPAEIERVLMTHEAITEVAVLPIPHPKWGEVGQAHVCLHPGCLLAEEELIQYCQDKLARFKIPRSIVFMDELPKNATGKIDRKALKVQETNEV